MGRSRVGCLTCKKRRRKCDETRPDCLACRKRGIPCEGYQTPLRWVNGISRRGRFAGASVPEHLSSSRTGTGTGAGTGTRSGTSPKISSSAQRAVPAPETPPQSSDPVPASSGPDLNQADLGNPFLFAHAEVQEKAHSTFLKFLDHGLYMLVGVDAFPKLRPMFQRMATESLSLITVAAAIQSYIDDSLSVGSLELIQLALKTFQAELASNNGVFRSSTVSAGLLICTLNAFQALEWTHYLNSIVEVCGLRGNGALSLEYDPEYEPQTQHILEVMSIMDIHPFVIGRKTPQAYLWKRYRELQDDWESGRLVGVEDVSGLPRSLLDIFAEVDDLGRDQAEAMLWNWPGEEADPLDAQLWDTWRLAGVLTIRRHKRIDSLQASQSPSSTCSVGQSPGSDVSVSTSFPGTDVVLSRLINTLRIIFEARKTPGRGPAHSHKALIHPTVAALLEVPLLRQNPEWKRTLDDIRDWYVERDKFKLTPVTFELLDEAWEQGTDTFDIDNEARKRHVEIATY